MTLRMLSQPVNYSAEAAEVRFHLGNRPPRGLAQWRRPAAPSEPSLGAAGRRRSSGSRQQRKQPPARLHPDRARTFCLPDGWTSEGLLATDLARLHVTTAAVGKRKADEAAAASPRPRVVTEHERQRKSQPPFPTTTTRFGDQRPPPTARTATEEKAEPPMIDAAAQPGEQSQEPGRCFRKPRVPVAAADADLPWVAVDPAYYVIEQPAAASGVSIRPVQASGGALAHVGRNGQPAAATATPLAENSATAAAAMAASRPPNLSWSSEVADPESTVVVGARPGAKEAADAAAAAAALEEQRRSRRVVTFEHGADAAREAAVLERLRTRPVTKRQQQQQQQQKKKKHGLTTADYAALAPIATTRDELRRSRTEVAAAEGVETAEAAGETATSPVPVTRGVSDSELSHRPSRWDRRRPLLTRPFAAATFSPRYAVDAGLVISSVGAADAAAVSAVAAASAAGRIATGRSLSSSSRRRLLPPPAVAEAGGGDFLSIVRSVPGQLWSTEATVSPSQRQRQAAQTKQRQQRQRLASAPMPSTPRGDAGPDGEEAAEVAEAAEEVVAVGIAAAAAAMESPSGLSFVSLTSTKNSEGLTVKVPRAT